MTTAEWNRLMRQARAHAFLHGHRVKVGAVQFSPRSAARLGTRWAYVIDCPDRAYTFMRGH